jgi:hypothetical protein
VIPFLRNYNLCSAASQSYALLPSEPATLEWLTAYGNALRTHSQGTGLADGEALALLASTLHSQAYAIAYADGFRLAATVAGIGVLIVLALRRAPSSPMA